MRKGYSHIPKVHVIQWFNVPALLSFFLFLSIASHFFCWPDMVVSSDQMDTPCTMYQLADSAEGQWWVQGMWWQYVSNSTHMREEIRVLNSHCCLRSLIERVKTYWNLKWLRRISHPSVSQNSSKAPSRRRIVQAEKLQTDCICKWCNRTCCHIHSPKIFCHHKYCENDCCFDQLAWHIVCYQFVNYTIE